MSQTDPKDVKKIARLGPGGGAPVVWRHSVKTLRLFSAVYVDIYRKEKSFIAQPFH